MQRPPCLVTHNGRRHLVTWCNQASCPGHTAPLDLVMRTASAHGDTTVLDALEAFASIRYELDTDAPPDSYAAGIAALQQQQRATINPAPLFQMAAEKDRKAHNDRAAFEARDKQDRLAKLTREYRHNDANPLPAPRLATAERAPAPDPYAKALKERS